MTHVLVLATGGTIASTSGPSGSGAVATEGIDALLNKVEVSGITVSGRNVLTTSSFLLSHRDLRLIAEAVTDALRDEGVDGVVLTHGTDTMEESAYLLDLIHDSDKPVVLTGSQRSNDGIGYDGDINLVDAITVAGAPEARGQGVLIAFAGGIHPARGTRKLHTIDPSPFGGTGPLGYVTGGAVGFHATARRGPALPPPDRGFDDTRVDVVVAHPGADATAARAAVAAGARGVVILGTGAGNGNQEIRSWVAEAVSRDITVGVSSRAVGGPVRPLYGNGGASDLADAGALLLGDLPWPQARILLAHLISIHGIVSSSMVAPYI